MRAPYGGTWDIACPTRKLSSPPPMTFRAQISRFVDDKLSVIVLTNSDNADPNLISLGVAALYIPGLIPERTVAKIDPKIFDAYTGQYQVNPSVIFTITREGDKLLLQQGGIPEKQALLPESATNFFMNENRRLTYSFVKDENGQVAYLVVQLEGQETGRAKKIK